MNQAIMAGIIENEVICFASDHFTSVLVASIVTVLFIRKRSKEKQKHFDIYSQNLKGCDVPYIIAHRKTDTRHILDAKNLVEYYTRINKQNFDAIKFVAVNCSSY